MTQRFMGDFLTKDREIHQNQLVNGGMEVWQRDPNIDRSAGSEIVLYNTLDQVMSTFVVKKGLAATVAGGAGNFPASGYVLIDNEIIQYTSYAFATSVFTIAGSGRGKGVTTPDTTPTMNSTTHTVTPGGAAASSVSPIVKYVAAAANAYGPDKWYLWQQTTTPAITDKLFVYRSNYQAAEVDVASNFAMVVRAIGSAFGGTPLRVAQQIENYRALQGKLVSLTMRVRVPVAGRVRLFIIADTPGSPNGAYVGQSALNTAVNAYQTLTIDRAKIPTDSTRVRVGIEHLTSAGADTSYNNTYSCDNAMMNVGAPSEFLPQLPSEELSLCQRYYEKVFCGYQGRGRNNGITGYFVPYKVEKSPLGGLNYAVRGEWTITSATVGSPIRPSLYPQALNVIDRKGMFVGVVSNSDNNTTSFLASSEDDYIEIYTSEP